MGKKTKALVLFSGGLDSLLTCKVLLAQGIEVQAVKFVSPFFEYDLLAREAEYKREICEKYGIDVALQDISAEYIEMIRHPAHGYGKHFNPCVDCKIFMVTKAKERMENCNASFLATGEVIGQRPMSQRRDTLRVIERDSGCGPSLQAAHDDQEDGGILLRPLCAKNLEPTRPERQGLVERDQLYDLSGRSRSGQIKLAQEFGITDYPTPAGGCILTDPIVGERIKKFYGNHATVSISDMRLISVGRQFFFPSGGWLVMGRKESENETISALVQADDTILKLKDRPGPTALLRFMSQKEDLQLAADLVARYGKKSKDGVPGEGQVVYSGRENGELVGTPPEDGN